MVATLVAVPVLAACGGADDEGKPTVNSMAAAPAACGRTAAWTIGGLNLDKGIAFVIASGNCDNVAEVGEGTAYQRRFSCRIASLVEVVVQVNDANGRRLAGLRVIVPQLVVRLSTTLDNIDLELDPAKAPVTVNNLLDHVNGGFYNNTIFHRVIADFVAQGGGYSPGTPNPQAKTPTQPPIVLESNNGLLDVRGARAMARADEPNSAASQYYINVADNPSLDYKSKDEPGYAVFGQATAGLDVVDAISVMPSQAVPSLGLTHVPVTNVVVTARQLR
jgi:cyclophilin family peptidyl-prolyl cis-trans isomerase